MNSLRISKKPGRHNISSIAMALVLITISASFAFGSADMVIGVNKADTKAYSLTGAINLSSDITIFATEKYLNADNLILALIGENAAGVTVDGRAYDKIQNDNNAFTNSGANSANYLWRLENNSRSGWEKAFAYNNIEYYSKTITLGDVNGDIIVKAFIDNDNNFYYSREDKSSGYFGEEIYTQNADGNIFVNMAIGDNGEPIFAKAHDGEDSEIDGVITTVGPHLLVNGIQISPMADDHNDVLLSLCDSQQTWKLLKEYTPWVNVNILGYYTDPGVGNNQSVIFTGPNNEGYTFTTNIPSGNPIGLWLLNDTNNDQIFNGTDSYLFSERYLTRNSFANEHQWFMVYDVRSYKGTNSTYDFITPSEDYTTYGDYDYLIYIDDDHTSANWDHNDMILGILCNNPPVAECPGDTTLFVCDLGEICISGFSCYDPDNNLQSCDVSLGTLSGGSVCFTPTGEGTYPIRLIATDTMGKADTCETDVTITLNTPPTANCPGNQTKFVCDPTQEICIPGFSYNDPDDNVTSVQIIGCELHQDTVCFLPEGPSKTITYIVTDACGASDTCSTTITLNYNQPPVANCPGDTSIFVCDYSEICIPGFNYYDPDDNIADVQIIGCEIHHDTVCFVPEGPTKTITLIVTDECGLADTCYTNVNISLNTPPVAHGPFDSSKPGVSADTTIFQCELTDICLDGFYCSDVDNNLASCVAVGGTLDGTEICFTPVEGVNELMLIATDDCGEVDTNFTTVNVVVNSAPEVSCPGDTTLFVCNSDDICIPGFSSSDADDNIVSEHVSLGTLNNGTVCFSPTPGINTIVYTVVDACGDSAQCLTNVTVVLNEPPVANCPGDTTLFLCEIGGQICLDGFIATDPNNNITLKNVSLGTLSGTEVCFTPTSGLNTITFTVTDGCGEVDSCTTNIMVNLNNEPVANCPGDTSIFLCETGTICLDGFTYSDVDNNITSVNVTGGTLNGSQVCFTPVAGLNTITITVTDACGKIAQCATDVNVTFNQPPQVNCPGDLEISVCDLSQICVDGFSYSDPNNNITDVTVTGGTLNGSQVCFTPVDGVNTIILTVTDACSEVASCTTEVTVNLNNAPQVSCPGDQEMTVCDLSQICVDGFTYSDVDDNITNVNVTGGTLNGSQVCFAPVDGVNTIILTVTDACGEIASCTTHITVDLNNAPIANCPGDTTMFLCQTGTICLDGFTFSDVDDNITDVAVTGGTLNGSEICFTPVAGINSITLTVTDACGEIAQCSTDVNVSFNQPPQVNCPGDQEMTVCDLSQICIDGFSYSDADNNITDVTVTGGTLNGSQVCFTPVDGVNTITLTVTDACGEISSCATEITVNLNSEPQVSCPGNQEMAVCDLSQICLDGFSYSDADDNITDVTVTGGTLNGTQVCFTPVEGTNTITLIVTDACGEIASCATTITIELNSPPVANCATSMDTVVCSLSEICMYGFSFSDPDDNIVSIDIDSGTLNGDHICFTPVEGLNVITAIVTDECGASDTCWTELNVTINSAPEVSCPGDIDMAVCDLSQICIDGFTYSDVDNNISLVNVTGGTLNGSQVCLTPVSGLNRIILYVDDTCGEVAACTTDVNVTLNTPPVASCPQNPDMLVCDLSDICLDGFTFTDIDDNIETIDITGGTLNGSQICFTPVVGLNTITAVVTDECGEADQCYTEINISLNGSPLALCPNDTVLQVGDLSELCLDGFNYVDPDDNIQSASVDNGTLTGNQVCFTPVEGVNTITLTVVDECGLSDYCEMRVTIILNTCPQLVSQADTTVICLYEDWCDTIEVIDADGDMIEVTADYGDLTVLIDDPGHWLGLYCFRTEDYDCGDQNSYEVAIQIDDGMCIYDMFKVYEVSVLGSIDMYLEDNVYLMPGMTGTVGLYLNTFDCLCIGGLNASVVWDPSVLRLVDISPTANIDFGNEYHNININAFGQGTAKLSYIADLNNQIYHGPLCEIDPNEPIFNFEFQLLPGEYPTDFVIPICFINEDSISDNAVSDSTGYHVWWAGGCGDQPDSSQFGTWYLNLDCGSIIVIDECDLVVGDININRRPYEVGDAIVLANYLMDPYDNPLTDAQLTASDVNRDYIQGSIADLIMLINVINGADPLAKLIPPSTPTGMVVAHQKDGSAIVKLQSEYAVGGLVLEIPMPDPANRAIELNHDLNMDIDMKVMADRIRVMVYSDDGRTLYAGENEILRIGDATGFNLALSEVSIASAPGALAEAVVSYELPLPETFGIAKCYPNPFNPKTSIELTMPEADFVSLVIYDITGRVVKSLIGGYLDAGYHQIIWDGTNNRGEKISSGIYFARLNGRSNIFDTSIEKLVLLK